MTEAIKPILVGVGSSSEDAEALDLMELALRRAAMDAGSARILSEIDLILTPRGTWTYEDPGKALAHRLGSERSQSVMAELGVSQQGLINEALRLIATGHVNVVAIVGAESRAFNRSTPFAEARGKPDRVIERPVDFVDPIEIAAGIAFPAVRSYALIQQARNAARSLSDDQAAREVATLWADFAAVSAKNPSAAFGGERGVRFLESASEENRPLSTPYLKWHASQWTVNQAAALLICSLDAARSLGTDPESAIHPLVALESSHVVPLVRRQFLHRWPAMGVLGRRASDHLGQSMASIDFRELYSCFPVAVQIQADELGITIPPAPTVTGGMAFGGGPFNNFVLQALTSLVPHLRSDRGSRAALTTVSGLLTKPGLGVWSAEPGPRGPLVGDVAQEASEVTAVLPIDPEPRGVVTIEASTVFAENDELHAVAIARTSENRRCILRLAGSNLIDGLDSVEAIGTTILVP